MPSPMTDPGVALMLDNFLPSGVYYLCLFTADPGQAGTFTGEVSGGAYARQVVNWDAAAARAKASDGAITFPIATAVWGTITRWGLADSLTGGLLLLQTTVAVSKDINPDDQATFADGGLTVSVAA